MCARPSTAVKGLADPIILSEVRLVPLGKQLNPFMLRAQSAVELCHLETILIITTVCEDLDVCLLISCVDASTLYFVGSEASDGIPIWSVE